MAKVAVRADCAFGGLVALLLTVFLCFSLSSSGFPRHLPTVAQPLEGPCDTSTHPARVAIFYNANGSYNYASGRLDHQTYYKSLRVEQAHLEAVVLDRVLSAWLDEAVLIPELWPDGLGPFADWPHQWFWDGQEHVDPAKEAAAQATRLANHTTTLAYEYARQGRDWEEALRQRAKELSLMRELGLSRPQALPGPADEDEADDEEEELSNAAATA